MKHKIYTPIKKIGLITGVLSFFIIVFFVHLVPDKPQVSYLLAVATLMAILWLTEAIPICITSLLPVVLYPVLGIMSGKDVSVTYFNHIIFLFIGGFVVSLAMERWNLHKRIALKILMIVGNNPMSILLGFMTATAFLSMWISNTATAMMMIPIVLSVIAKLEEIFDKQSISKYSVGLLLGIAYSASIGGIATLVGTPPNLAFVQIYNISFPNNPEISFVQWMIFAFPISLLLFLFAWIYLYLLYKPKQKWQAQMKPIFKEQYKKLGKMTFEEKIVLIAFTLLAFLWLFRSGINIKFGNHLQLNIKGWASIFPNPKYFNDGTAAIAVALLLFLIPAKNGNTTIVDKTTIVKLPWNIILLFGGGFALAAGFTKSGFSEWIGQQFTQMVHLNIIWLVFIVALIISFTTELTSNTATTQIMLPILAGISKSMHIHPLMLMLPATIAASLAFMFPIATPPNTIIFGTNKIKVADMVKTGFVLNMIGVILITAAVFLIAQHTIIK